MLCDSDVAALTTAPTPEFPPGRMLLAKRVLISSSTCCARMRPLALPVRLSWSIAALRCLAASVYMRAVYMAAVSFTAALARRAKLPTKFAS